MGINMDDALPSKGSSVQHINTRYLKPNLMLKLTNKF